jgi:CelD/BcsL family acetyltransferase involved in cellulose biosynthesis
MGLALLTPRGRHRGPPSFICPRPRPVQNPSYFDTMPQTVGIPVLEPAVNLVGRSRVEVLTQIGKAEPLWRELVQQGANCSRYQHYSWMSQWWNHIGSVTQATPQVIVLRDETGKPILMLPLLRKRLGPIHTGFFMGGKHTNFNLPVWRPELLKETGLDQLVEGLRSTGPRLDLLILLNQPASWQGVANPMLQLPHAASPSQAYGGELKSDFEELLKERMGSGSRKKFRQKERQLAAAMGPVTYLRARTHAEIDWVLEAFFTQKGERMRELGLSNAFDGAGVKEFATAAAHEIDPDTGEPIIELYAALAGDAMIATFGGILAHGRFSGMFNSIAGAEFRDYSPGELLLSNVVRMCCERGCNWFDLGIGDAAYKQVYCKDAEPLYDSIIPITAAGRAVAPFWRAGLAVKSRIKQSDALLRGTRFMHQLISRKAAA